MKRKGNGGFSLIETLVAIAVLGIVVVPTCTSLVTSHKLNYKTDEMLHAQLAVSSAVEKLMAEGIYPDQVLDTPVEGTGENYGWNANGDIYPDVNITVVQPSTTNQETGQEILLPYYDVTVTSTVSEGVSVSTSIRYNNGPAQMPEPTEGGQSQ